VQALLAMDNKAITTSGNYRRFFDQGGTRFAHSIDPATGEALHSNIVSVTVIAGDAITADGYDNALILMGVERGLSFIEQHPECGLEAYFVFKDEQGKIRERFSPGFEKLLIR
jgi:thiamine biosynthesis lipoprotein